jgi:threonine/homoserine efflux transporter RhtA
MSIIVPLISMTCTATFNLAPVPASVESDVALALTFIGVMLIAAFKSRKARRT